nr:CinA family nicotinamide mononucleotide deamidase-related protein [Corallincola luteus]
MMDQLRIAMISTGDEVLQGDIVDTNAAWLSQLLNDHGLQMSWRLTVADDLEALQQAFLYASQHAEVVIVNGGLGPTTDDLSAEAASLALNEPLVEFGEWTRVMESRYAQRGRVMPESNRKQAMLPGCVQLIDNPVGSACGFRFPLGSAELFFTPGVPSEFKYMVEHFILPVLQDIARSEAPTIERWLTFGLSESKLSDALNPIKLPAGAVLGYRSAMPSIEVKLKYTAGLPQPDIASAKQQITDLLGENLFCHHNQGFAAEIQRLMLRHGKTLSLAESCTGGMIAAQLVEQSGSSAYFLRGYVTYSNSAKSEDLGIPEALIEQHGAVSLEVAEAMAKGARKQARTDFAVAVTGIAGPDGGSEQKPVGTVGFSLATPQGCYSQMLRLPNRGRTLIREIAAAMALDMLRRFLNGETVLGDYEFIQRVEERRPG